MAPTVTEIVNNTQQVLNLKVGNQQYFVDFTKIRKGSKLTMQVDHNDTYQEFLMGPDRTGKNVIVTSDDCCDFKCITITEVDGQFTVDRVPRMHYRMAEDDAAPVAKKPCQGSSWKTMWKLKV